MNLLEYLEPLQRHQKSSEMKKNHVYDWFDSENLYRGKSSYSILMDSPSEPTKTTRKSNSGLNSRVNCLGRRGLLEKSHHRMFHSQTIGAITE